MTLGCSKRRRRSLCASPDCSCRPPRAPDETPGSCCSVKVLQALATDGDSDAAAVLAGDALLQESGLAVAAAAGNDKAISALLAQLQDPAPAVRRRVIVTLGASGSERAVRPLIGALEDSSLEVRVAAAEALGRLGSAQAIPPLKARLDDVFPVRYQAAAALFALHDMSGLSWLRQLETSQEPGLRLAAAYATRSQPDESWKTLVRDLTSAEDPDIRRQAAELLAPHDPPAAKAILEPLLKNQNVAERELARATYLQYAETNLANLRQYLRSGDADARLQATVRILELTR